MVDVGSAGEDRVSRSAGLLAGGIGAAIARICWGLPREVGSGPRPAYRWAPPRAAANVLAAMPLADPHFSIVSATERAAQLLGEARKRAPPSTKTLGSTSLLRWARRELLRERRAPGKKSVSRKGLGGPVLADAHEAARAAPRGLTDTRWLMNPAILQGYHRYKQCHGGAAGTRRAAAGGSRAQQGGGRDGRSAREFDRHGLTKCASLHCRRC